MKSWNRRFFLPSVLVCCVLISAAVLAQSNQNNSAVGEQEVVANGEVLPVAAERISSADSLVSDLGVVANGEEESSNSERGEQPQIGSTQTTQVQPQTNTSSVGTSNVQVEKEVVTSETKGATQDAEQPDQIQIKLVIQGPGISKSGKISIQAGSTVYQVMKQGSQELDFSLKTSHHSSLGIFVEGIAGVTNNPKTNLYWLYYLNGQFASRGVSLQTVQEGDTITWSYE